MVEELEKERAEEQKKIDEAEPLTEEEEEERKELYQEVINSCMFVITTYN